MNVRNGIFFIIYSTFYINEIIGRVGVEDDALEQILRNTDVRGGHEDAGCPLADKAVVAKGTHLDLVLGMTGEILKGVGVVGDGSADPVLT